MAAGEHALELAAETMAQRRIIVAADAGGAGGHAHADQSARTGVLTGGLEAGAALANEPSWRILRRLGFVEIERVVTSLREDAEGKPVESKPVGHGLTYIDHLTHNVHRGRMGEWASFYERLFNFREIRYFDIQGEYTGLTSKAMTAPDGKIRIPLNEESKQGGGQIEEFLMQFNGEGIQHIALICDNLLEVVDKLGMAGVPLATAPNDVYYEMLDTRLPGHGQPVPELQSRGILLDGTTADGTPRLLLQIFSTPMLGPVFFEFIQREGDYRDGFGEGNFKALFESLERDQIRRGVLAADKA